MKHVDMFVDFKAGLTADEYYEAIKWYKEKYPGKTFSFGITGLPDGYDIEEPEQQPAFPQTIEEMMERINSYELKFVDDGIDFGWDALEEAIKRIQQEEN